MKFLYYSIALLMTLTSSVIYSMENGQYDAEQQKEMDILKSKLAKIKARNDYLENQFPNFIEETKERLKNCAPEEIENIRLKIPKQYLRGFDDVLAEIEAEVKQVKK